MPDTPKPQNAGRWEMRYVTRQVYAPDGIPSTHKPEDLTEEMRAAGWRVWPPESTLPDPEREAPERFRLMRLCVCEACGGTGKTGTGVRTETGVALTYSRCQTCRGEGRELQEVATCATPEAVGVALVTLGREGEWAECPVGVLDSEGAKGKKWIVRPWMPSARNVSDAGKLLRAQR